MNFEKLSARVSPILLSPRRAWPEIGADPASVAGLYTGYIMVLAALPAVFGFIKSSVIDYHLLGATIRNGFFTGLAGMFLTYALSLVLIYVVALIVNALAPSFGSRPARAPMATRRAMRATAARSRRSGIAEAAVAATR